MTVAELFSEPGLEMRGPVPWETLIREPNPGIYVVALVNDPQGGCTIAAPYLDETERERWLECEPIIYIGQTTKQTLTKRTSQFYGHKYGHSSPHSGGQ